MNRLNLLIRAFVAHEMGEPKLMSDPAYDALLSEVKASHPDFNIFDYLPIKNEDEEVKHRSGLIELNKEYWHELDSIWNSEEETLPKYDGSSLVIYYTLGKLVNIVSMRDKDYGIDQTEKFREFVPLEVPENISYLRAECLVDTRLMDNARGKANGLVNSKYLQGEIEELASLVCFSGCYIDGTKIPYNELRKLHTLEIIREGGLPKFMISKLTRELDLVGRGECGLTNGKYDFRFAIDGVVWYNTDYAAKYDYINSAVTTVIDINWNETGKEGFFPTVSVEPVELEGKWISTPSSNGVPVLVDLGIGVGATVEVVFSGTTIPKIINVLDPRDPEPPTCPYCSEVLDFDTHLFGSTLRCTNPDCARKRSFRYEMIMEWLNWDPTNEKEVERLENHIKTNIFEDFMTLCNIPRLNFFNKLNVSVEEANAGLKAIIEKPESTESDIDEYLNSIMNLSDLQESNMWIVLRATLNIYRELLSMKLIDFIKLYCL